MNLKNNMLKITLFLCFFAVCFNLSAATKPPTLAIINKNKDTTLADLLFIELAKDNKIKLVEREKLDLILKEQELASGSKDNNIKLGRLLKADGLLFIEPDKDLIHVRLVETTKGIRLFDEAFQKVTKNKEMANISALAVKNMTAKLGLDTQEKILVALIPTLKETEYHFRKKNLSAAKLLQQINTFLAIYLNQAPNILMIERENLANVVEEQTSSEKTTQQPIYPDVVIRYQLTEIDKEKAKLNIQITPKLKLPRVIKKELQLQKINEGVKELTKKILPHFSNSTTDLVNPKAEANLYNYRGQEALSRNEEKSAMRFFELAYLLDDTEKNYKYYFVYAYKRFVRKYRKRNEEYDFMLDNLEKALHLTETVGDTNIKGYMCSTYFKMGSQKYRIFSFLYDSPKRFSPEKRSLINGYRRRLKKIFEEFCRPVENEPRLTEPDVSDYLVRFVPVFFEKPKDAIDYLQPYLKDPHKCKIIFNSIRFEKIPVWQENNGIKIWLDFLEKLKQHDKKHLQFYARQALFLSSTNGGYRPPKDPKHMKEYMRWLMTKENLHWMINTNKEIGSNWYNISRFFDHFHEKLTPQEQLTYIQKVILPILSKAKHLENNRFISAFTGILRFADKDFMKNSDDRNFTKAELKECLDMAIQAANKRFSNDKEQYLKLIRSYPSLIKLYPEYHRKRVFHKQPPSIPEATIIYDYARDNSDWKLDTPEKFNKSINGFSAIKMIADKNIIWLAWPTKSGFKIIRVNITDQKNPPSYFDLKIKDGYCSNSLLGLVFNRTVKMCVSEKFLFLHNNQKIIAIPKSKSKPFLKLNQATAIGPQINPNLEISAYSVFGEKNKQEITCLTTNSNKLYIFTSQQWNRDLSKSGIYSWQPGKKFATKLYSSSSLKVGTLNDCSPYNIFAASAAGPDKLMFCIRFEEASNTPNTVSGIWGWDLKINRFFPIKKIPFGEYSYQAKNFATTDYFFVIRNEICYSINRKTLKKWEISPTFEKEKKFSTFFPYFAKKSMFFMVTERCRIDGSGNFKLFKNKDKNRFCLFNPQSREFTLKSLILTDYGPVVLMLQAMESPTPPKTRQDSFKAQIVRPLIYHIPNNRYADFIKRKNESEK